MAKQGMRIAAATSLGEQRTPLTRERVLEAAVQLADHEGIDAVSMRRLAQELGVEAMSLYTHVESKDDLLNGMVEAVVGEIPISADASDWKSALRSQIFGARQVLLRHPWAPAVIEGRSAPGPTMLRYYDVVMGTLREGGFTLELTHHAIHMLGSRMLGFTQDLFDDSPDQTQEQTAQLAEQLGDAFPYVVEMALAASHSGSLGGCDDDVEFELGLDVILDGLERLNQAS
jgi:AcrR family transcriptional regulator